MSKHLLTRLTVAACALASAGLAFAQAAPQTAREARIEKALTQRFERADANHDGKLTLAEAQVGMPRVAKHFDQLDGNHQGYLTLAQLQADLRSRLQSRQ